MRTQCVPLLQQKLRALQRRHATRPAPWRTLLHIALQPVSAATTQRPCAGSRLTSVTNNAVSCNSDVCPAVKVVHQLKHDQLMHLQRWLQCHIYCHMRSSHGADCRSTAESMSSVVHVSQLPHLSGFLSTIADVYETNPQQVTLTVAVRPSSLAMCCAAGLTCARRTNCIAIRACRAHGGQWSHAKAFDRMASSSMPCGAGMSSRNAFCCMLAAPWVILRY